MAVNLQAKPNSKSRSEKWPLFRSDRLARLAEIEHWHFWFVGRRALVGRLIGRYLNQAPDLILDLGCGTGSMTQALSQQGYRVVGMDLRLEGLHSVRCFLPNAMLVQANAEHLPFKDGKLTAALFLDALEHLDEGRSASELARILQPGGPAIVAVPAISWFWSYRDEDAGHRQRYSLKRLVWLFNMTGFHIEEVRHYQFFLLPLVVLTRLLGRRGPRFRDLEEKPGRLLNTLFLAINRFEVKLGDFIRWPWGSSIVLVIRRRLQ